MYIGPNATSDRAQGYANRYGGGARASYEAPPERDGRGIGTLIRDLSRDLGTLARQEVALAKAEISEKAKIAGRNAAYIGAGALVAYAGFMFLLLAITGAIAGAMIKADVSPAVWLWLAPLIVAIVVMAVGGALVFKAIETIKHEGLAPTRTAQSLRETKQWVKEKVT